MHRHAPVLSALAFLDQACEGLVRHDETLKIAPALATSRKIVATSGMA